MNTAFSSQINSLIDSSISINKINGQRMFARRIELSALDRSRATSKLIEECVSECQRRNIRCDYNTHHGAFNLQIDVDKVSLTRAQAAAYVSR